MTFLPDKIGANPKQLAWLGGLVVVLIAVYFWQREPDVAPVTPAAATPARQKSVIPGELAPEASSGPKVATRSGKRADDFRPSIKLPDGMDVTKIDPRLKTELLAKLQNVVLAGGARSVFDYGSAPVPPPPKVAPIKPEVLLAQQKERDRQEEIRKNAPPVKIPPPPIPLKFYGYANRQSGPARQAFFLDGEDIQIKGENDVIRGRYKIVRIGVNSAVVEDLQSHDQQTLPLVAELNT